MTLSPVPNMPFVVDTTKWESFQQHYDRLMRLPLDASNLREWLAEWSALSRVIEEVGSIIYIEATLDTTDQSKEQAFLDFIENIEPEYRRAEQKAKERRSLYKTLAVCAAVIVASKAVGNVIAPKSREPYRSTF